MCGRYASFLPAEALARIFGTVNPLPNLAPTWNLAPTMDAPVVRQHANGELRLDVLKWGLLPYFTTKDPKKARKPINARSETIAKLGMFRAAFAQRRCLVPAPAYYEWRDDPDGKTPFAVACVDGDPVAFGGIWEMWKSPASSCRPSQPSRRTPTPRFASRKVFDIAGHTAPASFGRSLCEGRAMRRH
jgi:putative SOS response-associated peptidase YedK